MRAKWFNCLSNIMKLKDKIIKIVNGNYEDFIAIRNANAEKYWFIWLESVVLDWTFFVLMMKDSSFISVTKNNLYKWFISLTLMEWLEVWDTIKEDRCNKKTALIRSACDVRPAYNLMWWIQWYIFLWIKFVRNELRASIYAWAIEYTPLQNKYFVKDVPRVVENNSARLKELLSDTETPREKVKGWLMRAAALPFIKDLHIDNGYIFFTFLPYQLDLGNGFKINMPDLKMKFYLQDRKFVLADNRYIHPHISNNFVCLWTFQSVINATRWNFDIALITMYEHACTYNKSSPFWWTRPFVETSSNSFYSKCTFEYLWMTYTWQEFTTHLAASYENRNEYHNTIVWYDDSVSGRKSRFNIKN